MNVRHIPFWGEKEENTGYPIAEDEPVECPNGSPIPCDCRDFWIIRYRHEYEHEAYVYVALRCDAHAETPISDCSFHSDSLRDVLLSAGFRITGKTWGFHFYEIGDGEASWATMAPRHLDASEYEITPESQAIYWAWKGGSLPTAPDKRCEGGCLCSSCEVRR